MTAKIVQRNCLPKVKSSLDIFVIFKYLQVACAFCIAVVLLIVFVKRVQ